MNNIRRCVSVFLSLLLTLNVSAVDLVKLDKSKQIMQLISNDKIIKQYRVALGANPRGHKQQEGDERTPEGLYQLDYVKLDSAFYKAMHISYPNAHDIQRAKRQGVSPGGFILVHGQPNGKSWLTAILQRFNWTDGCIALSNEEMDEFVDLVEVGTPIEIAF